MFLHGGSFNGWRLTDLLKPSGLENRWVSSKTTKVLWLQDNSAEFVFLEQVLFQQQWIRSAI